MNMPFNPYATWLTGRQAADFLGITYSNFAQNYKDKKVSHVLLAGALLVSPDCPNLKAWRQRRLEKIESEGKAARAGSFQHFQGGQS